MMLWNLTFQVSINTVCTCFRTKYDGWMVEFSSHSLLMHENVDMPERRIHTCRWFLLKASLLLVGENGEQRRFLCLLSHFWRSLWPFGHPSSWALAETVVMYMEVKTWKWGTVTFMTRSMVLQHVWCVGWNRKRGEQRIPFWTIRTWSLIQYFRSEIKIPVAGDFRKCITGEPHLPKNKVSCVCPST